ncbi:MAG: agmatinase family protein [Flavobacteriales bacterium]|nr:agmatinase family protein [Flavobacteriales bacterium]
MGRRKSNFQEQLPASFDSSGPALEGSGIFGLPYEVENSTIVLIPVPWEVTVSYRSGTAKAPKAILKASHQVDLFHLFNERVWRQGICMDEFSQEIEDIGKAMRRKAEKFREDLLRGRVGRKGQALLEEINSACHFMNEWVRRRALDLMSQGKMVGVVGGDHSTPLGLIQALCEHHSSFSILQIDAHCDLRNAYEGFRYSHASVMYNALHQKPLTNLVQVGVRDLCEEEYRFIENSANRVTCFHQEYLNTEKYMGRSWKSLCDVIVSHLGEKVYISFDIDGLEPHYCPHTGTPVPGGLSFGEAVYLIRRVVESGRTIIGFDLNEVVPSEDEWDANVGARVLYELCAWTGISLERKPRDSKTEDTPESTTPTTNSKRKAASKASRKSSNLSA